jgi:hypothetical protein
MNTSLLIAPLACPITLLSSDFMWSTVMMPESSITCVNKMWDKERLWYFSVLQRIHSNQILMKTFYLHINDHVSQGFSRFWAVCIKIRGARTRSFITAFRMARIYTYILIYIYIYIYIWISNHILSESVTNIVHWQKQVFWPKVLKYNVKLYLIKQEYQRYIDAHILINLSIFSKTLVLTLLVYWKHYNTSSWITSVDNIFLTFVHLSHQVTEEYNRMLHCKIRSKNLGLKRLKHFYIRVFLKI